MDKKYYIKNAINGIVSAIMVIFVSYLYSPMPIPMRTIICVSIISAIFTPFAKKLIENVALKFTSESFWHRGLFKDDIGKNGFYAMYYLLCFIFAIPLGVLYFALKPIIKTPMR